MGEPAPVRVRGTACPRCHCQQLRYLPPWPVQDWQAMIHCLTDGCFFELEGQQAVEFFAKAQPRSLVGVK